MQLLASDVIVRIEDISTINMIPMKRYLCCVEKSGRRHQRDEKGRVSATTDYQRGDRLNWLKVSC